MNKPKRFAANLALVAAGVLAAFLIAEVVVRVTGLANVSLYTWAPYRGWTLKDNTAGWQTDEGKGFVSVNSAGFRGPEWKVAKPPGTYRIAVIGDSFTEGAQVNYKHTFCAVAQRALSKCKAMAGKKVQVMDFGIDAYGTAQEIMTLDRHAWKYSPDMVVLAFFSGNDVRNNSVVLESDKCRPFYVYKGDLLVLGGPFETSRWWYISCLMRFESRHSQVLNLLGDAKSDFREHVRQWEAERSKSEEREAAKRATHRHGYTKASARAGASQHERGLNDNIYHPPTSRVWKRAWRVTDGLLTMLYHDTQAHHVPLLVVTLANPPQIYPNAAVRASYMQIYHSTNIFYPGDRIKALGERDGFTVLNLAPPMQAYVDEHHVFLCGFKDTRMGIGHWNAAGHHLAGELIAQRICQMLSTGTVQASAR